MCNSTVSLKIKRQPSEPKQTLGEMSVLLGATSIYNCKTMELPWKNNEFQVSCIPAGIYKVKKRKSSKYGEHFHIQDVPKRSLILIHVGNFHSDLLGCIAPGKEFIDPNKDKCKDVTDSKNTMKMLNSLLPDEFELTII